MTAPGAALLTAMVGLGSNRGDRRAYLRQAVARLAAEGAAIKQVSDLYTSAPLGMVGAQPTFLNAVALVRWPGDAEGLLQCLLAVERMLGRVRPGESTGERRRDGGRGTGGPASRTVDLDLLAAWTATGHLVRVQSDHLTLPHPRMLERAFVLEPALQVAAAWPLGGDVAGFWKRVRHEAAAVAARQEIASAGAFPAWQPDVWAPLPAPDNTQAGRSRERYRLGSAWRCLESVGSTNEEARQWAAAGAPDGAVVVAERQTQGRGRLGRAWETPRGAALALSLILRPGSREETWSSQAHRPPTAMSAAPATAVHPLLPFAAGLAVAAAASDTAAVRCRLKWPNDVRVNGRKLAGILGEAGGDGTVVLGVGVNLNLPRHLMPAEVRPAATSLLHERGGPVDRQAFLRALLSHLEVQLQRLAHDPAELLRDWRHLNETLGRRVVVRQGEGTFEGFAEDVGTDGALVVRLHGGQRRSVYAGEVSLTAPWQATQAPRPTCCR